MKLAVVGCIAVIAFSACAVDLGVRSVSDAIAAATREPRIVRVAGYYMFHSEGDSLLSQPGSLGNHILLFGPGPYRTLQDPKGIATALAASRERAKARARLDGKYVVVTGMLQRGRAPFGDIADCVFITVANTEEANKAPEPTLGLVMPRAEPRVMPIPSVAHL